MKQNNYKEVAIKSVKNTGSYILTTVVSVSLFATVVYILYLMSDVIISNPLLLIPVTVVTIASFGFCNAYKDINHISITDVIKRKMEAKKKNSLKKKTTKSKSNKQNDRL